MKRSLVGLMGILLMTSLVFGANEYILEFDGTNDYVYYADDATLGRLDGAENYTIEAWIYPDENIVAEYDRVLQRFYSFAIVMYDGNNDGDVADWYFYHYDGSSWNYYNTEGDATLTLNAWNHVAVINNEMDGSLKLYVNGTDVTTTGGYVDAAMQSSQNGDNLYIGSRRASSENNSFGGYIDEVRFKNVAENPSNLHYNRTDPPYSSDGNTGALFHFDEGTGTSTVNEASSTNASLNNGVAWQSWDEPEGADLSLPVDLTFFKTAATSRGMLLEWQTASEIENLGFRVERREAGQSFGVLADYQSHPTLSGSGSSTRARDYSYLDRDVREGVSYQYRLYDIDYQGRSNLVSEKEVVYFLSDDLVNPAGFALEAAYPNPFNPSASIRFMLSEELQVDMLVFDTQGRRVADLLTDAALTAGQHTVEWQAAQVPAGVYFLQLTAGGYSEQLKLVKID